MTNIFIDPFVLACPKPEEGLAEFHSYIESLITWRDYKKTIGAPIYISAQASDVLAQTNSYPPWESLTKAISILGIEDVQAKDIVVLVNALLMKLPILEDNFGIEDILIDNVIISPCYHLMNRNQIFIEQYERIAIIICCIQLINKIPDNQVLITRKLVDHRCYSETKGTIIELISSIEGFPLCPFEIIERFFLCNSLDGLYLSLEPTNIWKGARTSDDYETAIRIYVFKEANTTGTRISFDNSSWSMKVQFLETAHDLGFLHEDKKIKNLLRACAQIILATDMRATHALRKGSGAEEPQRIRSTDKAKAWRRDIDYDYHLHYWESPSGIELAAIVIHSNMEIPE